MEGLDRRARSTPMLECSSIDDSDLIAPMALSVLEAIGCLQPLWEHDLPVNAPAPTRIPRSTLLTNSSRLAGRPQGRAAHDKFFAFAGTTSRTRRVRVVPLEARWAWDSVPGQRAMRDVLSTTLHEARLPVLLATTDLAKRDGSAAV